MGMRWNEVGAVEVIELMQTDPRVWNRTTVFAFLSSFSHGISITSHLVY
jgi:hypothetical protein